MPHCEKPVPEFSDLPDISMEYDEFYEDVESSASDSGGNVFKINSSILEQFKQDELSDLIRDLNYLKKQQKFWHLGSKTKKFLNRNYTNISPYKRKRITSVF